MFNWTEQALRAQFDTAKANGWLPFFTNAATTFGFEPSQLMAVASRESGSYWAKHPAGDIMGDAGDALGLFQINSRFHPDRENYTTVDANIMRGAKILSEYRKAIAKKLHDDPYSLEQSVVDEMLYASYNRGVGGMWKSWREKGDPDAVTMNGNYAADCLARAAVFQSLFAAETE